MPISDIIFANANVITLDSRQSTAKIVAVKNGKILFVGASSQINAFKDTGTKVVDCGGKTLVPGFNDAHCHILSLVRKLLSIDVGAPSIKSVADIKAAMAARSGNSPAGLSIQDRRAALRSKV